MVFGTLFAGCQKTEEVKDQPEAENTAEENAEENAEEMVENTNLTEPGTFPVVKEMVEISLLMDQGANVESLVDNEFTKYLETETNVKIDITQVPTPQLVETINLVIASRDYPDGIIAQHWTRPEMYSYGESGVFLPLGGLIDQYSTYYKKYLEDNPNIVSDLTTPTGEMYAYTTGQMTYHMSAARKMWLQQDFLTNLGLETPKTLEDFKNVLIAVRDGDANGNGDPNDEIPLIGCIMNDGQSLYDFTSFLSGSFIHYPGDDFWRNNDGTIQFVADTEEWKALLAYEKELFDEGLFPIESFTQDNEVLKNISASSEDPIIFAMQSHYTGWYATDQTTYEGIEPLVGPDGKQEAINTYRPYLMNFVITSACENPEVLVRWADYFYSSDEALMNANYGPEGIGWEPVDASLGWKTGLGGDAKWQSSWDYKDVQKFGWGRAALGANTDAYNASRLDFGIDGSDFESIKKSTTYILASNTDKLNPFLSDDYIPPMFYEVDDSALVAENLPTIDSYVKQSQIRFINGTLDLEKDWDTYVAEFEKMAVPEITAIKQATFDNLK
jgi:putative aldouronate transport system substrate-binding protein